MHTGGGGPCAAACAPARLANFWGPEPVWPKPDDTGLASLAAHAVPLPRAPMMHATWLAWGVCAIVAASTVSAGIPSCAAYVGPHSASNAAELHIATWNMRWFFDGHDDPSYVDPPAWRIHAMAREIVHALGAGTEPALLAVQEVESCEVLHNLTRVVNQHSAAPFSVQLVPGTDTATRQQVALLSRGLAPGNLTRSEGRHGLPVPGGACGNTASLSSSTGVSKHFMSLVQLPPAWQPAQHVLLVGVHLLSKPNDPVACAKREGQALALLAAVNSTLAQLEQRLGRRPYVVVLGDFNDLDGGDSLSHAGVPPNSRVLHFVKSQLGLQSVATGTTQANRWSIGGAQDTSYLGVALDHVLVDARLREHVQALEYRRTPQVWQNVTDHAMLAVQLTAAGGQSVLPNLAPTPAPSSAAAASPTASAQPSSSGSQDQVGAQGEASGQLAWGAGAALMVAACFAGVALAAGIARRHAIARAASSCVPGNSRGTWNPLYKGSEH